MPERHINVHEQGFRCRITTSHRAGLASRSSYLVYSFIYPTLFHDIIFVMNIDKSGSGTLKLGTWFAVSVPLVAFLYAAAMLASRLKIQKLVL